MREQLKIHTLGNLSVQLGGQPITGFESRKVPALLVYLASHPRPHPREVLAEMLWENRAQSQSLANLRVILTSLRQKLGPYFTITRETVELNPDCAWWLDTAEFERCLSEPHQTPAQLEMALALYRGDFLDGFYVDSDAFDDWIRIERERLRFLAIDALDRLAQLHRTDGDFAAALNWTTRLLQMDSLREASHRQMMQLLALSGQREAALAQYEVCRHALEDELHLTPMPDTTTLYERIRAGDLPGAYPLKPDYDNLEPIPQALTDRPRYTLPAQMTPFIGRQTELNDLANLLDDESAQLITIVGPGGVGKSRLGIEAARAQLGCYTNGVFFVSLAASTAKDDIIRTVAEAVGFQFDGAGMGEVGVERRDPQWQLLDFFRHKHLLLILDNFEHLLEDVGLITAILESAPQVRLLVTSRERLNLSSECLYPLGGMVFTAEDVLQSDAARLFEQSARRVQPYFALHDDDLHDLKRIHDLVGGLPLGLQLAAAWMDAFSLAEIAREIERNLDVLASDLRDVPERHRSLRAVFDSSWDQLAETERATLRRLSVFRGGFTAEAAWQVAGADLRRLTRLGNKSLLRRDPATGRYEMHELLRQYAVGKLDEAREETATRDRHCAYFAQFVRERRVEFFGDAPTIASGEVDNLHVAWDWGLTREDMPDLRWLWIGVFTVYFFQGLHRHVYNVYAQAVDQLRAAAASQERDLVLGICLALQGWSVGDTRREEALELIPAGVTLLESTGWSLERVWGELASVFNGVRDPDDMQARLAACLAYCRTENDPQTSFHVQLQLAIHVFTTHHTTEAAALSENRFRECVAAGNVGGPWGHVMSLFWLGFILGVLDRWEEGMVYLNEALPIAHSHRFHIMEAEVANQQAYMALGLGDLVQAEQLVQQVLVMVQENGSLRAVPYRDSLGYIKYQRGAFEGALQLFEQNLVDAVELGNVWLSAFSHSRLGFCELRLDQPGRARHHFERALVIGYDHRHDLMKSARQLVLVAPIVGAAILLAHAGDLERAAELVAMTSGHPHPDKHAHDEARLRDELEAALPPEVFAAAWARGAARTVEDVVEDLVHEWCSPEAASDIDNGGF
jgi:predicted ATPase/DNA-binding SARP family transcriptional activator